MVHKVLITGGCGFIASHIVPKFSKKKYDVFIVDDLSTGKLENINKKFVTQVHQTSIIARDNMIKIFHAIKPDIVLHLAAQPSLLDSIRSPFTDLTTNGVGTQIVAQLCKNYNASKLVYASTSAVMDEDDQSAPLPIYPIRTPTSPYGLSKLVGEMYVKHFMTDAIILRLGNVYGERQVPLGENQLVPRAIRYLMDLDDFEVYGSGDQTRDYVYAGDVADAFFAATKAKQGGTYYVGSGVSSSVWDVLDEISLQFDKDIDWKMGKARDDREKIVLDVETTANILGWKAKTSLAKGIKRTTKWWKEQYD